MSVTNKYKDIIILGIESSCDETSAAVLKNDLILSNLIANQTVHQTFGGVVPELASRAHQQNIIPVIDSALKKAGVQLEDLTAIAYTQGPGLIGALMVGSAVAKSLAQSLAIPLIPVNHMQGHVLAHFVKTTEEDSTPEFPFLCLTVSGGHTQLILVKSHLDMELVGQTIDDAAGEAFDKSAKLLGLPYPGGPLIDKFAKEGNPLKYHFPEPKTEGLNYSFSGLKTSILYFLQDQTKLNPDFIQENMPSLCASIQYTLVSYLVKKLEKAAKQYGVKTIAIAGGVSANSYLRLRVNELGEKNKWKVFVPEFQFCTDNAAMIAITGLYKFKNNAFGSMTDSPMARINFD